MATAAAQLDEETLIREKIAEVKLPAGVKFKRLLPIIDSTGDPAWRIYFSVSRRIPITPKYLKQISAMTSHLQDDIIKLGLGKFPYTKLEDAR